MKNNFNTLHQYIFENSVKEYRKETVNGLFRSILEPIISNQKLESCILLKINDIEEKESLIKRLSFSNTKIYSYNDNLFNFEFVNCAKKDIWGRTEFLIVLGQRYSAALIWDYSIYFGDIAPCCILYNSKLISDIAKQVLDNSIVDFKELLMKYAPDRRENMILNQSINSIVSNLNEKNEEIIFSEHEKKHLVTVDDKLETAEIVAEKAKFIAHEIKNNLSIINLYSKIAEKRVEKVSADEETINSIKNSIENITTASENVSSLIADLRCLSSPYKTQVNIKLLVLNTIMLCQEKANKSAVRVVVNEIEDCVLTTDKTKFQCALTNIIFNAIEACKESCTIWIDCVQEDEYFKVFVRNNGEMIPVELQSKIFDLNFTTKEKGNGLGLDICSKQLELVGGGIKLVSSDENETIFEIYIPI